MTAAERSKAYRERTTRDVQGFTAEDFTGSDALAWLAAPLVGSPIRCWWVLGPIMPAVCAGMDSEQIRALYSMETVEHRGYRLRYAPGHWLDVRKGTRGARHYQIRGFFGGTFAETTASVLGERIGEPTQASVEILATAIRTTLSRIVYRGHVLAARSMGGPGGIANRVLRFAGAYPANKVQEAWSETITRAVDRAFYGGRIETYGAGYHPGPIFRYDLHSAYPWALARAPRLGAEWYQVDHYAIGHPVALYRVRWDWRAMVTDTLPFGPLPWRSKTGRIVFRAEGEGWYWQPEVAEARRCWPGIEILEGYVCLSDRSTFLRRPVEFLYKVRQQLATEGSPMADVVKLVLTALWGKLAQSVGQPRYGCIATAGWTTASVRAVILAAMRLDPGAILAVMTDGLLTSRPLPLNIHPMLGGWSVSEYTGVHSIGPGQYRLYSATGEITDAWRGFPRSTFDLPSVAAAVHNRGIAHASLPLYVTPILAAMSPDAFAHKVGTTHSVDLRLSPFLGDKRTWDSVHARWLSSRTYPDLLAEWVPNGMVAGARGRPPEESSPRSAFQSEDVHSAIRTAMVESGL